MRAIDVHTHFVPADFPRYLGKATSPRWPTMVCSGASHIMEIGGEKFRAIQPASWDGALRVTQMAGQRIEQQVVSPMPELLSYWLDVDDALSLGGYINDKLQELHESAPNKFLCLGTVPLQDPKEAVRVLQALLKRPGFRGVEIGTHVNGVPIGDPRFNEFFAAAQEFNASIFVHALHPIGGERLVGPAVLQAAVGYPCEMAFAISSLLTGGVIAQYPNLRICCSHGGGAFASVLPRLEWIWSKSEPLQKAMNASPRAAARSIYYDDLVYDGATLRHLLGVFGEDRIVIGTDYPFIIHDPNPLGSIEALDVSDHVKAALLHGNAKRFLDIKDPN
jgi:aminocarboxymuconate-semialdehyde decarboxylase